MWAILVKIQGKVILRQDPNFRRPLGPFIGAISREDLDTTSSMFPKLPPSYRRGPSL